MSVFDTDFTDMKTHLNYEAFDWLPHDKWIPDRLINEKWVNGKRMCKVMDCWVNPGDEESHVAAHIEFDKTRRAANKLLSADINGTTVRTHRELLELNFPEGEFTISQVAEFNSADRSETRSTILTLVESGQLVVTGTLKGGRGRPAILYRKENTSIGGTQ